MQEGSAGWKAETAGGIKVRDVLSQRSWELLRMRVITICDEGTSRSELYLGTNLRDRIPVIVSSYIFQRDKETNSHLFDIIHYTQFYYKCMSLINYFTINNGGWLF